MERVSLLQVTRKRAKINNGRERAVAPSERPHGRQLALRTRGRLALLALSRSVPLIDETTVFARSVER